MYSYEPTGVCSKKMNISINDENKIEDVQILAGCPGNLLGLSELCKGQDPKKVIAKLRGITCGTKKTSCPDQLSYAIEEALREKLGQTDENI